MDIQKILQSATQKGLSAIESIRSSITPQNIPNPISAPIRQPLSQLRSEIPQTPAQAPVQSKITDGYKPFGEFKVPVKAIEMKPETAKLLAVKPETQRLIDQYQMPLMQRQAKVLSSIPQNALKTVEAIKELIPLSKVPQAVAKNDISILKPNTDKIFDGLEIFNLYNDLLIQPSYDAVKLYYAEKQGKKFDLKTKQEILRGDKPINLNDILGNTEQNTDVVKYNLIRFADFAPALIDLPLGQVGKTQKFAKEFKVLDEAGKFAPKLEKIVAEKLAQFEQTIGRKLTPEETTVIRKNIAKPTDIENAIKQVKVEAPITPSEIAKPVEQAIQPVTPSITGEFKGTVPPSGNIPPVGIGEAGIIPTKERRFPSVTVKEAPSTAKGLKNIVDSTIYLYSPIKNKDEFAKAVKYVSDNAVDDVISALRTTDDPVQVSYVGQALMNKLQKEGNFARASEVLDIVSESATRSGQAIQALSIWGRLTPEGALRKANDIVRKYNSDNKLIEGTQGYVKLSDAKAKEISDQAKKVQSFGDDLPYDKAIEISKLQRLIASVIPAQLGEKISAVQTLAQLLNPKTFIRNVLGNAIFGSVDALTQSFASLLDLATSLYTKKRTVAPANIQRLFSGGVEGAKMGLREALEGADTSQLVSQFDLPNASVFDSKVMQGFEKALNVTLKAPDRAFYQATYDDTLEGLMDLAKTDKPTKEMLEIAHYEGLRRTFQDENKASQLFTSLKRAFNKLGIKGFGLGDLVLKYPKTPANLLVRGLEYTPLGYISAVIELARPLMGQAFDQRAFVNNLARASVGTGTLNLGYALAQQGILSPRPNSDRDARASQDLQGIKSYSFNVSALKRYVLSGFDPEAGKPRVGDQLFSYDWAQPAVFPLAMGANIAENGGKIKDGSFADKAMLTFGPLGAEIIQSSDTLTEQPLLQGIKTLFSTQNLQQGLLDTVVGAAGSFVPTLLNQINQYTDNVSRETYSPDYFESAYNKFAARIPLLAQKLPARSDILGRTRERFPNASNTFFNVFFNPAFTDQIKADPVLAEVISIYEQTGETGQFPRIVDKSIQVNGERKLLSTQELVDYQKELGQLTNDLVSKTITTPEYAKLPTEEKSKLIANMISDSNKIAKVRLFGDSQESLTQRTENLLNNEQKTYIDDSLINAQKSIERQKLKAMGITKKPKLPSIKKGRKIAFKKPKKPTFKAKKIKTPKLKKLPKVKPIKFTTKI